MAVDKYMNKISTNLWFDKEAREAAKFYVSVFQDAAIDGSAQLEDTPSGSVDLVNVRLLDHRFALMSAGPLFKFTPAISFMVACGTEEEVDRLWALLSAGGKPLMDIGSYPFSTRYGWIQDKYGLSWQIMAMGDHPFSQRITPTFMFTGSICGQAEQAINFYASVFHNAKIGDISRYNEGEEPDKAGTVRHAAFTLEDQEFAAMDSAREHNFGFNEAISLVVRCETQQEIDYYWSALSAVPAAEQCGWLKDKYGLSWQIVPAVLNEMMTTGNKDQVSCITQAFLKMKKFDIAALKQAFKDHS